MNLVAASDPVLWTPAAPLTAEDRAMHQETFKELTALMNELSLVGLSLPQVGLGFRGFVTRYPNFPIVTNPRWHPVAGNGYTSRLEGSASKPGWHTFVRRPDAIHAFWYTETGEAKESLIDGIESRVFQHECDHLSGICVFARPAARMSA